MPETFINKIRLIVLKNIENDAFGVSELASELGFSRSQILRKVKTQTGKSANQFIREIRLEEAVKLLKEGECTASEIAYKVGFSSPSYFNKCFLVQYGFTPGEYKKRSEEDESFNLGVTEITSQKQLKNKRVWLVAVFMIIAVTGFYSLKNILNNTNNATQYASIAVLPLDDYSENKDKEYLASGITEAINLELSKNKSIRVVSRGSCERFKGDKKPPYSEIAKDLGVDLLLEGSVFPGTDTLRVVVQLIKPFPEEKHVWANSYHQTTSNVLQLVRNVSSEIANEIFSVVEPDSSKNKIYEVSTEAYDLYLKGRHIWNNQKTRYNSLISALGYMEESVKIDSGFAPAYVTMAEIYISINKLILDNEKRLENRENARKAVDKAFQLDNSLAEAYITKANLIGKLDWNWNEMKELAEKGSMLDPNNSHGYLVLSDYYTIKGNYQKAIGEALKAENLDPLNPNTGCILAEKYYIAGEYQKSIDKYNAVIELNPNYGYALNGIGFVYLQVGERDKAKDSWQKLQDIMGNESLGQCYNDYSFEECLHFYLENAKKDEPRFCNNPAIISSVHMIVDEESGALEYLDIAYRYKNEDLPVMLSYPDFYPLHDDPEFKELVQNVGVVIAN